MPNLPLVFKTYQDVKNNLVYWTFVLLVLCTIPGYYLFLTEQQRNDLMSWLLYIGNNTLLAGLVAVFLTVVYFGVAIVLIYGLQIHDVVYDKLVIQWRKRYDIELILANLTKPFSAKLPINFAATASKNRYQFMKPYYEFVGDGKPGIQENTRIRFYERVTLYWVTQLNEVFALVLLLVTPIYALLFRGSFSLDSLSVFVLVLVILGIVNRWCIRCTLEATTIATLDEIEEILAKRENVALLEQRYEELCRACTA